MKGSLGAARRLSLSPHHAAAVSDARILRIFGELSSPAAAHPLLLGVFQFSVSLSGGAEGRCFTLRRSWLGVGPFWRRATRGTSE